MNAMKYILLVGILLFPYYVVSSNAQSEVHVEIAEGSKQVDNGKFFVPSRITIEVGTKVVWKDLDDSPHTVTDGTPQSPRWGTIFDSGIMRLDDVYEFTFNDLGTYRYLCSLHPWMAGTVVVLAEGQEIDNEEAPIELSVRSDRTMYKVGDSVIIEGSVSSVGDDSPILMEISNPNNEPIVSESLPIDEDGSFNHSFRLVGKEVITGEYTVKVTYSGGFAEGVFVVEKGIGGGGGSADLKVIAKQIKDLVIVRVSIAEDSVTSIYGITIETSASVIKAFRGPRNWSSNDVTSAEATTSVEHEPLNPGNKTYFMMKVSGSDFEIGWTAYDSAHNVADTGTAITLRM